MLTTTGLLFYSAGAGFFISKKKNKEESEANCNYEYGTKTSSSDLAGIYADEHTANSFVFWLLLCPMLRLSDHIESNQGSK